MKLHEEGLSDIYYLQSTEEHLTIFVFQRRVFSFPETPTCIDGNVTAAYHTSFH